MSRIEDVAPYLAEHEAACGVRAAAHAVQDLLYYHSEDCDLPAATRQMWIRLYRGLYMMALHYFEEDGAGLVWNPPPPGIAFKKSK